MSWYYAENNERRGPIEEAAFGTLVNNGTVKPETLVWRSGMPNWVPYSQVASGADGTGTTVACVECSKTLPAAEMVRYEGRYICPSCKPLFFQKVKEGAMTGGNFRYAGFWIRLVAYLIDFVIQQILAFMIGLVIGLLLRGDAARILAGGLGFIVSLSYVIFFVGAYGATPGKMALRLRIIRADGSPVGYGLATGRFFSQIVSGIILCVGYIMIGFDEEKRGLHDRMCETRVIRE